MRKCKLCGQSGLLFSLTIDHESGYCPKCLEFEKKYEDKRAMKLQLKKESQRKE